MGNPGFLALVSEANAPGVPFGGGAGAHNVGLEFTQAATPDLSHGVFKSWKAAPGIYEWGPESSIQLVSALPEGSATSCSKTSCQRLGARESGVGLISGYTVRNAISANGTRVIWTSTPARPEREQHLFVRDTATTETVQLDVQQSGTGASGPAEPEFATASTDGSRVFFTDTQRLTPDSKAGRRAPDLYVAELNGGSRPGEPLVSKLIDLTPEGTAGNAQKSRKTRAPALSGQAKTAPTSTSPPTAHSPRGQAAPTVSSKNATCTCVTTAAANGNRRSWSPSCPWKTAQTGSAKAPRARTSRT